MVTKEKKDKLAKMFEPAIADNKIELEKDKSENKVNPIGVALDQAELDHLNEIAQELGQSRHAVLQYAVRNFIKRYDQGEKPATRKETKTVLDA